MKMTVSEFAHLTGVSVRTLHYYDEIGLLVPCFVDRATGYRFCDEESLSRMQQILFYRELDFSLGAIAGILSSPDYDRRNALREQRRLLELKKQRLEKLIGAIDDAMNDRTEGDTAMTAFVNNEYENHRAEYAAEAKARWGHTEAYKESEKRASSPEARKNAMQGMEDIMEEFARCMQSGASPADDKAQALVKKWQDHISASFYTCTTESLKGLGEMYSCDERFKKNIDKHAEGTAVFMTEAIRVFCRE
ncbi:MAG: MerR family transcriptional regulator [Clostridiales bacterium]|nr:MerR family transcriptional regulator [Clostridiales bacterium]